MSKRRQAFEFFVQQGWDAVQSAGIVANLEAESGLRHDAVGDGGQAYGIAQWHPPRQEHFAQLYGKPIQGSSFEEQLAFVRAELQTTEKAAGTALAACLTPYEAGACVSRWYERPADREGEAAKRGALAERIFVEMNPDAALNVPAAPVPQPETKMPALALLQLFAPILSTLIPQIAGLFKPGSEVATRNVGIAQVVLDTIVKTTGATNLQGAIDAMQDDKAVAAAVQQAVVAQPEIVQLMEIGPGQIKEARQANIDLMASADKWWKIVLNPVLIVTCLLLPMVYMIVWGLMPMIQKVSPDVIAQTIGTIVGLCLGAITGFWMGQTFTQSNKRSSDTAPAPTART